MVSHPIQLAVVLATATTTVAGRERAIALLETGGISQLRRTLLSLRRGGVQRFVVVTGSADAALRRLVADDPQLAALEITWVRNAARPLDDVTSLTLARPHVPAPFFIAPVDRVFGPEVLETLMREPLDGLTLAVSRQVHHPGLARVMTRGGSDATFTGIAAADRRLFAALSEDDGPARTLEGSLDRLQRQDLVGVADIGDGCWAPVRDDAERRQAQRLLLANLRKSVDGIIARHINRRFSLAMTRWLMHTPVRPNHITAFALLVSLAAAVTASFATAGTAWWLLVGAVLWQLASMLDGIDGELARLKFTESKIGEWFDTLTDDIGKFAFFVGSGVGATAISGQAIWLQICVLGVAIQAVVAVNLYRKLLKMGVGSHFALAWEADGKEAPSRLQRLYGWVQVMGRRDYYVFAWMCLVAVGLFQAAIGIMFITTMVILVHELRSPREVRDSFPVRPNAS